MFLCLSSHAEYPTWLVDSDTSVCRASFVVATRLQRCSFPAFWFYRDFCPSCVFVVIQRTRGFLHFTFTTLVRRRFSLSEALRRLLPSFCRCITLHKGRPVLTALLTLISESQCCITLSLLPWQCPRLSQQWEKQLRELCPKWAVICSNLLALLLWAGARVRSNWVYIQCHATWQRVSV